MHIEITEIEKQSSQIYLANEYVESGFYFVTTETTRELVFANIEANFVSHIAHENQLKNIIINSPSKKIKRSENDNFNLSENFVLKLIALTSNKETYKAVND